MKKAITWSPRLVKVSDIIANPNNPKKLTDLGVRRLSKSIGSNALFSVLSYREGTDILEYADDDDNIVYWFNPVPTGNYRKFVE